MAEQEMAGEDATMDQAVDRLMALGLDKMTQDTSKLDRLEASDAEIDVNAQDGTTDLEEIERDESAKADAKAETDTDGEDAGAGETAETFIELPSAEEGKEGERVPLAEAVEAVQQMRQLKGDITTAVIRVEEEAYQKQDELTKGLQAAFENVSTQARIALQAMQAYFPQAPDPIMLDRNSGYYDPEGYHLAKLNYDKYREFVASLEDRVQRADKGRELVQDQSTQEQVRREHERIARYIPQWKDEKGREAFKTQALDVLGPKYGLTKADLDDLIDHKAWRMVNDLVGTLSAQKAAPEIRKAVQEKAPKLVKGKLPERDQGSGRFVNAARAELKKTGSEEAFVNVLLSGAKGRRGN